MREDRYGSVIDPNGAESSDRFFLPTMPYDPGSRAGRYLEAILAELSDRTAKLSVARPISARDLGNVVEILFPGVEVDGGRVRLGDVGVRIGPRDGDRYDFDLSWNGRAGFHAGGARFMSVIAADPRMKGQWDAELQILAEFDGETGPIDLMKGGKRVIAAKALSVNRKLLPSEKERWAEDSSLHVSGLDIDDREGNAYARIGDFRVEFRRTDIDPAVWMFFSDAFASSRASGKTNETIAPPAGESGTIGEGEMRFADIEVVGDKRFALGKLVLRLDYRERSGNFFVALAAPHMPGVPFHFLPERIAAEVEVLEFPLGRFFAAMGDKRFWSAHGRKAFSGVGQQFLSRAGRDAEFRVAGFKVELPPVEANVHGTLRPDGAGGLVGELRARIAGLDDYLGALPKTKSREAMMFVAFLKGLGRPVVGNGGRIAYAYDIDFSSGGLVAVNGMPLGPLVE